MMEPQDKQALQWLYNELLDECLRTNDFSIVEAFLPSLGGFEREELLRALFWDSLCIRLWWLAEKCLAVGVPMFSREESAGNPLHCAMAFFGDRSDIIAWLLDHGAKIENRDLSYGNSTPLLYAVAAGLDAVAEMLLRRGADVNARTLIDDDQTPLMIAAKKGNVRAVKLLLAHGAESTRIDRWGHNAAMLAQTKGYFDVQRLLAEKRAKADARTVSNLD